MAITPYVYVVVRGIAVTPEEEEEVRQDVSDKVGSDYVVMLGAGPRQDPEVVPDAAA